MPTNQWGRKGPGVPVTEYVMEPLNMGEIIDRTINIFTKNFNQYLNIVLIYLPFFFTDLLFKFLPQKNENTAAIGCMAFIFVFLALFALTILEAASVKYSSEVYMGKSYSGKEALTYAWQNLGRILGTQILSSLILGGLAVGAYVVIIVLIVLSAALKPISILMYIITGIVGIGALLLFVRFAFAYALTIYVVIMEDKAGYDAIKRSSQLFFSSKDAMNKIILLPILTKMMILGLTIVPFIGQIFSLVLMPLPIVAMTLVYYDIRIRSEGLDIELSTDRENETLSGDLIEEEPAQKFSPGGAEKDKNEGDSGEEIYKVP